MIFLGQKKHYPLKFSAFLIKMESIKLPDNSNRKSKNNHKLINNQFISLRRIKSKSKSKIIKIYKKMNTNCNKRWERISKKSKRKKKSQILT